MQKTLDTQRITPDQLRKDIDALCAKHGYRQVIVAIGKRSGQASPAIDVVADTHVVDIAYIEVQNGATP